MYIELKDKTKEVRDLETILNSLGLQVDYTTADLIFRGIKLLEEKGDEATLMDVSKLRADHQKKWELYLEMKDQV